MNCIKHGSYPQEGSCPVCYGSELPRDMLLYEISVLTEALNSINKGAEGWNAWARDIATLALTNTSEQTKALSAVVDAAREASFSSREEKELHEQGYCDYYNYWEKTKLILDALVAYDKLKEGK